MSHDDDNCPHLVRANLLEAENARLKAEVERLKTEVNHLMVFCNCTLIPNKELQAHIERLTYVGDVQGYHLLAVDVAHSTLNQALPALMPNLMTQSGQC